VEEVVRYCEKVAYVVE